MSCLEDKLTLWASQDAQPGWGYQEIVEGNLVEWLDLKTMSRLLPVGSILDLPGVFKLQEPGPPHNLLEQTLDWTGNQQTRCWSTDVI